MEKIKPINKTRQLILAAATWVTLWVGSSVSATDKEITGNPLLDGLEAIRPDMVPKDLVGPTGFLTEITAKILYIVGVLSVIMLIVGGVKYILSGGDQKKVSDAKNTLLYAIIGLIIAVLSFAIIRFVLNALGAGNLAP